MEDGEGLEALHEYTKIDPWFLAQVRRAGGVAGCSLLPPVARVGGRAAGARLEAQTLVPAAAHEAPGRSTPLPATARAPAEHACLRSRRPQPLAPPHPHPHRRPQLGELHEVECWLKTKALGDLSAEDMRQLKQRGFSDSQIARAVGSDMMAGEDGGVAAELPAVAALLKSVSCTGGWAGCTAGCPRASTCAVRARRLDRLSRPTPAAPQCARRARRWAWCPP